MSGLRSPLPYPRSLAGRLSRSLKELGWPVLWALKDMLQDMSVLHRILFSYLLFLTTAAELLRPDRTDTYLSVSLGLVKFALVVDCILVVTRHLTRLSASNRMLAIVVYQMPFVTGPLSEFELARLMLTDNATSAANTFLVGCVYVKPLVAGALCLALYGLHTGWSGTQPQATDLPIASLIFLQSGVLMMVSVYGLGLESLKMPTAAAGDSQWLFRGVPFLLLLSVVFTCYFWYWHAEKYHATVSKKDKAYKDSEWVVLLVSLVVLKVGAARLVYSVLDHIQAVAWTADKDIIREVSSTVIHFAILPLAATAVDHIADISAAYRGDIDWPWASLCQSTLQTLFSIRPLFTLVGHDLDPQSGRIGIALCFLGIALWLSLSALSREFSLHDALNGVADTRRIA
ncbi:hypothetical protein Alg130_10079 [Pyrenophora tritici-repentis]|nr:hypothetical protein Alg130_10079 [Pyrenophora tritici-repentis]